MENRIFTLESDGEFNDAALEIFHRQRVENPVYRRFVESLVDHPEKVADLADVPFLPIETFKNHRVFTGEGEAEMVFTSTGTTGVGPSSHHVKSTELYRKTFTTGFRHFYGSPRNYRILALLPSYLEREGSSLVYMMEHLITESAHPEGGFFLNDISRLKALLSKPDPERKTLLMGVSFALLDLAEEGFALPSGTLVMETGGMKGRRTEPIRDDLHRALQRGFGVDRIHSEYGMAELLSQAYSVGEGIFRTPPWMKFLVRDLHDPLSPARRGRTGGLNVVDLANMHSCAFVATSDLGRQVGDDAFEILGRLDHSDMRGCNLMVGG